MCYKNIGLKKILFDFFCKEITMVGMWDTLLQILGKIECRTIIQH